MTKDGFRTNDDHQYFVKIQEQNVKKKTQIESKPIPINDKIKIFWLYVLAGFYAWALYLYFSLENLRVLADVTIISLVMSALVCIVWN